MKQILITIWEVFKTLCFLLVGVLIYFVYSYKTLYRDEWALAITGGNPMPHESSYLVLAVIVTAVFHRSFKMSGWKKYVFVTLMVLFYVLMSIMAITTITDKP